ncbi:MAG: PilZ domain-containing protein [Sphingomicrobium sp.]
MSDVGDRRRADRVAVAIEARVRPLGEEGCEARIVNISATGFMAATSEHYEVGARIWLMLPGRERASALVKWIAGDKLGAEFAEPINLAGLQV